MRLRRRHCRRLGPIRRRCATDPICRQHLAPLLGGPHRSRTINQHTRLHRESSLPRRWRRAAWRQNEYCLVEASPTAAPDLEILRVVDGQDDAVTLHTNAIRDSRLDNAERACSLGHRASGSSDDDQCWLDDVRIAGAATTITGAHAPTLTRDALYEPAAGPISRADGGLAPSANASAPTRSFHGRLSFDPAQASACIATPSTPTHASG